MDMSKMGQFLATLRKEQHLTQSELGEKLGVTNKTISRWETGTYLPPVEMLEQLSHLYGLTINELLSGERLSGAAYQEKAEQNIKQTLKASTFGLKEKEAFYCQKWKKEHLALLIFSFVVWLGIGIALHAQHVDSSLTGAICGMLAMLFYLVLHNRMMMYVEHRLFDADAQSTSDEQHNA